MQGKYCIIASALVPALIRHPENKIALTWPLIGVSSLQCDLLRTFSSGCVTEIPERD